MTQLPIPIPAGFQIAVKVDQKITQGEIIATSSSHVSEDLIVNIAADLASEPSKTEKFLIKKPGERVEAGDLIAKKGGIMGSREIRSKVTGTIVNFNLQDGTISIRSDGEKSEESQKNINSPVDGQVVLCDNDKVVLKTDKEAILAEQASGETSFGEVFYIESENLESIQISEEVSAKILIAKNLNREVIAKAIGLSAVGAVGVEISDEVFENLRSKKIKTPVLKVSEENFKKIAKKNEKLMLDSVNSVIIKL